MFMFKPRLSYMCTTWLMDVAIFVDCLFLMSSAVPKCVDLEIVTTNGISLMCIMSTSRVTCPCHSSITVCSFSNTVFIRLVFFLVVFPCRDLILVPKMSWACMMSAFVTGKFGMIFISMYLLKSAVVGRPIMSCKEHA